jgi:hypothetical protein
MNQTINLQIASLNCSTLGLNYITVYNLNVRSPNNNVAQTNVTIMSGIVNNIISQLDKLPYILTKPLLYEFKQIFKILGCDSKNIRMPKF